MKKKIFLVDLDHTIFEHRKGPAYKKAVDVLNEVYDHGHEIVYYTARGLHRKDETNELMKKYKLPRRHKIRFAGKRVYIDHYCSEKRMKENQEERCVVVDDKQKYIDYAKERGHDVVQIAKESDWEDVRKRIYDGEKMAKKKSSKKGKETKEEYLARLMKTDADWFTKAQNINEMRRIERPASYLADMTQEHKSTYGANEDTVPSWANEFGSCDIAGVDTKGTPMKEVPPTKKVMKKYLKDKGMIGYSRMNRKQLVKWYEQSKIGGDIPTKKPTNKELRKYLKSKGVKGYSKMDKMRMMNIKYDIELEEQIKKKK